MIEENKLLADYDSKNLFCRADLRDIFKELRREPTGCMQHCPFCGVVCEVPGKLGSEFHSYEHKQKNHYLPCFLGTKLMI